MKSILTGCSILRLVVLSLFSACLLDSVASARPEMGRSIPTLYPARDWVVSDYVVTDPQFGAKAEPGFDNRAAFQAAIDAAYRDGGGVVYVPAGNYEFRSTQTGSKQVRVRQGEKEIDRAFSYEFVLRLPAGVQLRGDWADPEEHGGRVLGTVLEVRVGKNAPNHDGAVESWWTDSQNNNSLHTTYTSIADRFIEMNESTGVRNLSIWYPEQDIRAVSPYPWTLYQTHGDCATVENVTLVNSYNGFYSAPSELHYLLNSYITALNKGIEVHICTDIGRIENVKVSPRYWADSGLPGAPSHEEAARYTLTHGTGFKMHRSDWEYISYLSIEHYRTGVWIGREPGFDNAPNSQLYGIRVADCGNGLYVDDVNPFGLLISNSSFGAVPSGNAVCFSEKFRTSVQFNGVDFLSPVVSSGNGGVVSFENCTFNNKETYGIRFGGGSLLLTQCDFRQPDRQVYLGDKVTMLKSVNSGHRHRLQVENKSKAAKVEITDDKRYAFAPIPKRIKTDIAVRPKPSSDRVMKVGLPKASGFNNDVPDTDVSSQLQAALDELKAAGGGTLYLPAGRYLVDHPVVIPSGVELRGSWDVQHHTQGGGTALFTRYDGGAEGENGAPLIQISKNGGLNGLTLAQLNLVSDGCSVENPRKTPFLIQGRGSGVYIVNVTVALGDKGIDLASYNTDGHYVDYFAGVLLRAGIWVGGGAKNGFIRNMQFNPHYGARLPRGLQGYPSAWMVGYVQAHCSALKFADVKDQTIFNNFVYGSVYGIHFLKDEITGRAPGKMTVLGHGSDGCTYALFVEDAGKDTQITAINSELVNTHIKSQPMRSYILVGHEPDTKQIDHRAQLMLYNSSFWGSPVRGAIVNNGILRIQQGNFTHCGKPCIDVHGGEAHVYTTYFAEPMPEGDSDTFTYIRQGGSSQAVELTNNYYTSGLKPVCKYPDRMYGTDMNR